MSGWDKFRREGAKRPRATNLMKGPRKSFTASQESVRVCLTCPPPLTPAAWEYALVPPGLAADPATAGEVCRRKSASGAIHECHSPVIQCKGIPRVVGGIRGRSEEHKRHNRLRAQQKGVPAQS